LPGVELVALADVGDEAACHAAFQGCNIVVAVAQSMNSFDRLYQPLTSLDEKGKEEAAAYVLDTERNTEITLRAAKAAGARRVILTATMASVCGSQVEKNPGHIWTENDWNDTPGSAYSAAKTAGERKAWALAQDLGLELSTIHPAVCLGPQQPGQAVQSTLVYIYAIFKEKKAHWGSGKWGIVDIRDVAEAHVQAALTAPAGHRFLLNNRDQYCATELVRFAEAALPGFHLEIPADYVSMLGRKPASDPTAAERLLGHPLITPAQTVKDSLAAFQRDHLL